MNRVCALSASVLAMSLLGCTADGDRSGVAPNDPVSPPLIPATEEYGVRVRVVTGGTNLDPDGYIVRIQLGYSGGSQDVPIGVTDSVLFKVRQRPAAEGWFVRLIGLEPNCWVSLPNLRTIIPRPGIFSELTFSVDCVPHSSINGYDRVTAHWPGSVAFHGSLSERYVLRGDGSFRLQYTSGRFGFFEYLGTFKQSPGDSLKLHFEWDGDSRWSGTAILRNDSLFVDYNDIMIHSDFEPGVYVKAASTRK